MTRRIYIAEYKPKGIQTQLKNRVVLTAESAEDAYRMVCEEYNVDRRTLKTFAIGNTKSNTIWCEFEADNFFVVSDRAEDWKEYAERMGPKLTQPEEFDDTGVRNAHAAELQVPQQE
jgi:hypothetical protein